MTEPQYMAAQTERSM